MQQRYERARFDILLQAETPIQHGAETFGNVTTAMRRKIRLPGGGWANVAAVSGDAMRHGIREAVAYAFLDAAGMLNDPALSEGALRLLFAGGMVTGKGDASVVKLDQFREMCELVPPLALLGGCANNRVIPGRLSVDDALLICEETRHLVPQWMLDACGDLDSCRSHMELEQRVRMDPCLSPEKRKLLTAVSAIDIENRMLMSEAAHDSDDAKAKDATKSTMMPRQYEVIAAGSPFYWTVSATCYSDLELDVFHSAVAAFTARAEVGGKRGTGHGKLRVVQANKVRVERPEEQLHPVNVAYLAPKVGELFRTHVAERKDRIRQLLAEVNA